MLFECIYDLCKWNFLYNSSHNSTVALFIDMHGAMDVFNSKCGKAGESYNVERILFGSALQGSLIIQILFDLIYVYCLFTFTHTHTHPCILILYCVFEFYADFKSNKRLL